MGSLDRARRLRGFLLCIAVLFHEELQTLNCVMKKARRYISEFFLLVLAGTFVKFRTFGCKATYPRSVGDRQPQILSALSTILTTEDLVGQIQFFPFCKSLDRLL